MIHLRALSAWRERTLMFRLLMVALPVSAIEVRGPSDVPPIQFAVVEIQSAARSVSNPPAITIALRVGADALPSQAYRTERAAEGITVTGGDAVGAMYGGLDVAEALRSGALDSLKDSVHAPHIAQRGIKFNIPLDLRTPSYTEPSDAAQANIPEVWSMTFWRAFLDDMARHRFNVLSLWSLHPFPSIVKVPEFPHVALDDVWRTTAKLDDHFDGAGNNFVKPEMLVNHEVVKKLTIAEKIQFWRDVMQLAKDRGVDVYWFTRRLISRGDMCSASVV